MKSLLLLLALPLGAPFLSTVSAPTQSEQELAEMMAKAKRYTEPGPQHALLERFLGEWQTDALPTMGETAMPQGKGTVSMEWKAEGRWITGTYSGTFLGMEGSTFFWLGYDNQKMSYVYTGISTFDTAMNHAEGDLTNDGKSLILYGTLDEYLTGEHDKMVKYAWRFVSDDEMVLEVHDLAIGEENTKVLEFRYRRKK